MTRAVVVVRSVLFNIVYVGFTLLCAVTFQVFHLLPRTWFPPMVRFWETVLMGALKHLGGLSYDIKGLENLPQGPAILAAKHQSAFETLAFHTFVPEAVYILKKELLYIPFVGWLMPRAGNVPIDRGSGAKAVKTMLNGCKDRLEKGRKVVVFPEGTRTAPGDKRPYQPGVYMLYKHCDAPVVPVALNSGLFWKRKAFLKKPGRITVEILPAMPDGMEKKDFLSKLQDRIETASNRLKEEAETEFPHVMS